MDRKLFFLLPLLVPASAYLFSGCSLRPIQIGWAAELTGIQSEIGVQGRNGGRGIAGRRLELIIRDDGTTPEEAGRAVAWQQNSMSRTGEAIRPFYLSGVKNGPFVLIDEIQP